MAQRDYYEVLNVARDADEKEIKRAYRRLAMDHHPDRNASHDAETKFKEASEAYQVLSDPEKRRMYDRFGHDGLKNSGFSGFQGGGGVEDIFSSFGDIFGDLFGGNMRSRRHGPARGSDLRYEMSLEFKEAVFGCSKEISLEQQIACEKCAGSGSKPGTKPVRCSTCQGRGQVVHGQGMFLISTTCSDCQGQGTKPGDPCHECHGQGRKLAKRQVSVRIPAGFDDGMSLRYAGEGEPGDRGGPSGDLYVVAHVKPHKTLRREGEDIIAQTTISIVQAALGDEITVEGLEGEEKVTIPKGTQPNDVISLRKKGVPRLRGGGRGDLHVVCVVEVPKNLSAKQKQLLEEFAGIEPKKRRLFS
jgi:molecular chaperone DnaJ